MAYWHMQIRWAEHQTGGVTYVDEAIEKKVVAIGSDNGSFLGDNPIPKDEQKRIAYLRQVEEHQVERVDRFSQILNGDTVLLHAGTVPKALVRVCGSYGFKKNGDSDFPFQHRYPVTIISTYEKYLNMGGKKFNAPTFGTIQPLNSPTKTLNSVENWLKVVGKN
jgi:hypothetical protein